MNGGGVVMKNRQANHISFYILIVLTLLVSAIYIVIALKQNDGKAWAPVFSAENGGISEENEEAYMQNIREHRDRYSLTSVPWDQKLSFTVHIASDSPDIGKVLYEDDYGVISVGDIMLNNYQWWIYFDFTGKKEGDTFSLLSLDVDDRYPTGQEEEPMSAENGTDVSVSEETSGTENTSGNESTSVKTAGTAEVQKLSKKEKSDDWRVKISYPYENVTAWHKEYWNSEDQLPNGERIGYIVFYSTDQQVAAETSGEMDVTFTMKGLKRLIWQSQTSENTRNPSASD